MASRQFLWIDPRGADASFAAPGNIKCSAGDKGTLAIWQHAPTVMLYSTAAEMWRVKIDANNFMYQYAGRSFTVRSGGAYKGVTASRYVWSRYDGHGFAWELCCYTWDFSGGAGAGVMRAYWDGVEQGTAITNATAPVGTPTEIAIGPAISGTTYYQDKHCLKSLSIWDGVMTGPQVAELFAQGHRHRIVEADGTGTLLFMANFDGMFNAEIAAGSPTFTVAGAADTYCLMHDGIREPGITRHLLGTPRHDLSMDDRVPLYAALTPGFGTGEQAYQTATNSVDHAQLQVTAGFVGSKLVGVGYPGAPAYPTAAWLLANEVHYLSAPCTYRQRIHIPAATNPAQTFMRIGPVDYYNSPQLVGDLYEGFGSGRSLLVVADAGNSVTAFKTNLSATYANDYWIGAKVTFLTGGCAGRRLQVTDYDSTTKVITVEGALPAIPAENDIAVVNHRASIQACGSQTSALWGNRIPQMSLDAWLGDAYGTNQYYTELDWCYSGVSNHAWDTALNMLRYERGRTVLMDGVPHSLLGQAFGYGRSAVWNTDAAFYCDMLLERIEVEGPASYQLLSRDASGHGPAYGDNFLLTAPSGEGTKVWRKRNVTRTKTKPVKITNPALTKADLQAAGTWRQVVNDLPLYVEDGTVAGTVVCVLEGTNAAGVAQLGYVVGAWDDGTGRITWTDETPPAGKTNPFMLRDEMKPAKDTAALYATGGGNVQAVLRGADDDDWYMAYGSQQANVDHYIGYLLGPAADRWSFSRAAHWWVGNPFGGGIAGGADMLVPEGNGTGIIPNRDAKFVPVPNQYTKDPSRKYWAWARGKSCNHKYTEYGTSIRPIVGIRGADLRSMSPLPHGNQVSPLVGLQVHANNYYVNGQSDAFMAFTDTWSGASSGVYCYVSEDGVHWQQYADHTVWLPMLELVGENNRLQPGRPFRIGDRTIYYYSGGVVNFAWCRADGECWYELDAGQTTGMIETPLIEEPVAGWGDVVVNADPRAGTVLAEVLDEDDVVIAGYSTADCDAITDDCNGVVTWGGAGLDALAQTTLRLRFSFANAGGDAPRLYRWAVEDYAAPTGRVVIVVSS
jgi:hypothetical protein